MAVVVGLKDGKKDEAGLLEDGLAEDLAVKGMRVGGLEGL